MASLSFLSARRNVDRCLLTGFVKIFQAKELDEKFRTFSLSIKKLLRWAVGAESASLQQVFGVLRTKMRSQKADSFASVFAVTDSSLLREAETDQIRQVQKASTAVECYAASDRRVS